MGTLFDFKKPPQPETQEAQKIWDYLVDIGKPYFDRSRVETYWQLFSKAHDVDYLNPTDEWLEQFAEWLAQF